MADLSCVDNRLGPGCWFWYCSPNDPEASQQDEWFFIFMRGENAVSRSQPPVSTRRPRQSCL